MRYSQNNAKVQNIWSVIWGTVVQRLCIYLRAFTVPGISSVQHCPPSSSFPCVHSCALITLRLHFWPSIFVFARHKTIKRIWVFLMTAATGTYSKSTGVCLRIEVVCTCVILLSWVLTGLTSQTHCKPLFFFHFFFPDLKHYIIQTLGLTDYISGVGF